MLYTYRCKSCRHVTEAIRTVEERYAPCSCEYCGGETSKLIDMPARTPGRWGDTTGFYSTAFGKYFNNTHELDKYADANGYEHVNDSVATEQDYLLEASLNEAKEHEKIMGTPESVERINNAINNL